jgi:HEPN domain-containing protein
MAPIVHVVDPDPDTVIVLRNACTHFAVWGPVAESVKPDLKAITEDDSRSESSHIGTKEEKDKEGTYQEAPPFKPEEVEIHYHVSSRHLQLASPWFQRALRKGAWAESELVDGRYRILAEDWDEDALLIVLNIFHLRNRQVPRTVSLDMLAKVAVLVDYYSCDEAVELFTDMWIEDLKLKKEVPTTYCRDLVLWVWVSWVFDLSQQLTEATAVMVREGTETWHSLCLPVPQSLIGKL